MAEMITRLCPHCGKELQVPEELQEFSCLYCGQRIILEAEAAEEEKMSSDAADAQLEALRPRLLGTVTRYPKNCEKLAKKQFFVTFEAYENDNRGLMKEVNAYILQHPLGQEAAADLICSKMVEDLEQYMTGDRRWRWKAQRGNVIFEVKVVLAIFLTPMVRKMKLESAELFRETLHKRWMEKFPKDVWYPGDYEVLEQGYKKRKLCYITTATCRYEGKADDCAELSAFRSFRDGWLTEQGDTALIEEYYDKAPGLVACLELCDEAEAGYRHIREDYLIPCYEALQQGDNEACRARYIQMVQALEQKYSH